jgi:signal transduction histidine kinase
MTRPRPWFDLRDRLAVAGPARWGVVGVVLAAGLLVGYGSAKSSHRQALRDLVVHVDQLATAFSDQDFFGLEGRASEESTRAYGLLKSRLRRMGSANPADRFIYLMKWEPEARRVVFLADSAKPGSPDESKPGDRYENFDDPTLAPGLRHTIETGASAWEGPESDAFGTWYSAFARLDHPSAESGERLVLGVDMDASEWRLNMASKGALGALLTWLILGVPLAAYLHTLSSRRKLQTIESLAAKMEAENQRYQMLARMVPAAILRLDFEGNCLFCNDEWYRLTQGAPGEGSGIRWLSVLPRDERRRLRAAWDGFVRGGREFSEELRLRLKDGSERWVQCSVVQESDRTLLGAFVDRTTARLHGRRMEQNQRLESLGSLAGSIALELRNALTPVVVAAEALREGRPSARDPVEAIQQGASKAVQVVEELMSLVQDTSVESEVLNGNELLAEAERLLRGTLPKQIQIVLLPTTADVRFRGRRAEVRQALVNLCQNAIEAMPAGGVVRLRCSGIVADESYAQSVPGARPGAFVMLSVFDRGMGIPAERREKIFEPFYTTKEGAERLGLGLPAAARIAAGHEGFIAFYSEPDRGTEFSLYLPSLPTGGVAASPVAAPPEAGLPVQGRNRRILVVDDDLWVREATEGVLTEVGFRVVLANDGIDGLCRAAEIGEELCLVITDRHMPGMDGLEFMRSIRSLAPKVPIILASGQIDPGRVEIGGEGPDPGLLEKPFTRLQLLSAVADALAKAEAPSHAR